MLLHLRRSKHTSEPLLKELSQADNLSMLYSQVIEAKLKPLHHNVSG